MFNLRPAAAFVALAAALSSLPALAEEARYNQISLRAEVNQEVQRDLMLVTLYTEAQDSDPAKLAAQITETLNKALGRARQVKDVKIRQAAATVTRSTTTRARKSPAGASVPNCVWKAPTSRPCQSLPGRC